jgi:hypothetical protein
VEAATRITPAVLLPPLVPVRFAEATNVRVATADRVPTAVMVTEKVVSADTDRELDAVRVTVSKRIAVCAADRSLVPVRTAWA